MKYWWKVRAEFIGRKKKRRNSVRILKILFFRNCRNRHTGFRTEASNSICLRGCGKEISSANDKLIDNFFFFFLLPIREAFLIVTSLLFLLFLLFSHILLEAYHFRNYFFFLFAARITTFVVKPLQTKKKKKNYCNNFIFGKNKTERW